MVWIQFAACLLIIIIAGTRLSKYGDIIAEKTGLGRVWVGIVLLATVTSLPEVATGFSAVTIFNNPDLAIGDLFGAALINLVIIAVIDVLYSKGPVLHFLGTGIVLATILSMLLLAVAGASIFLSTSFFNQSIFGFLGLTSLVLFVLYLISQYIVFRYNTRHRDINSATNTPTDNYTATSLKTTLFYFSLSAVAIIGAGIWLGAIGDQIIQTTGLEASFVGTLFLAISTTAPEMVVSISSARLGAIEMAVGNVVGSNLFNIGVAIFLNDLFWHEGSILQYISTGHVLTVLFALIMSSVVIIGIIFRPRLWLKAWVGADTVFIAIVYAAALAALYFYGIN